MFTEKYSQTEYVFMNEDTTRRQRESGYGYANVDQNIYLLSPSLLLNLLFISYYFSSILSLAYGLVRSCAALFLVRINEIN